MGKTVDKMLQKKKRLVKLLNKHNYPRLAGHIEHDTFPLENIEITIRIFKGRNKIEIAELFTNYFRLKKIEQLENNYFYITKEEKAC